MPRATSLKTAYNHAMIYTRDVARALDFYRGLLGFRLIDEYRAGDRSVYARLAASKGSGTIALHALRPDEPLNTGGIRLYFETRNLDAVCARLRKKGARFTQFPKVMPWGWKHAYLDDPDGHEVSLYWAGPRRLTAPPPGAPT